MLKVVLDTNIILSAVSYHSPYRIIFDKLDSFEYKLAVSTEILLEYEEN
jgi:predicted nucleic acid-binding protein